MPDGFWFVSVVVGGLIAASEWSRRLVERGMQSHADQLDETPTARQGARGRRARPARRAGGVAGPAAPGDEAIAIPQWQRDP